MRVALVLVARIHMLSKMGGLGSLIKKRWFPVISNSDITYLRPIAPMKKFTVRSRIVFADSKYWFMEQRFESEDTVYAVGIVRGVWVSAGKTLPISSILELCGLKVEFDQEPAKIRLYREHLASRRVLEKTREAAS